MKPDRVEVLYAVDPELETKTIHFDDVPNVIKVTSSTVKALDGKRVKQVMVPKEWASKMIDFNGFRKTLTRLRVDEQGRTYVALIPALRPDLTITVYFGSKSFIDIVENIDTAIDFCDNCGAPIDQRLSPGGYCDIEGGGLEIETYDCPHCETSSIRFLDDWLKWHPKLREALELHAPTLIKSYAELNSKAVPRAVKTETTPQQRLGGDG